MSSVPSWIFRLIIEVLGKALNDEQLDTFKRDLIAVLRKLASEKTPDFPLDDFAVEVLARFLAVK